MGVSGNPTKRGPGDPIWDPEPGEVNWVFREPGDPIVHAYPGPNERGGHYTVCGLATTIGAAIANAFPSRCEYCERGEHYPPMC